MRKRGTSDTEPFSWQMLYSEHEYKKSKQKKDESEEKDSETKESETNPISQLIDATKNEMCKNGHCNWVVIRIRSKITNVYSVGL